MVSPPQVSNPSVEASLPHSSSKLMFSLLLLLLPGAWCMDSLEDGAGADFKRTNDNQPQNSIELMWDRTANRKKNIMNIGMKKFKRMTMMT